MNKCVSTVLDLISNAANKDDWDPEGLIAWYTNLDVSSPFFRDFLIASNLPQTSSSSDTQTLIGAVTVGKGLKLSPNQKIAAASNPGMQPANTAGLPNQNKYPSAMKAATKPVTGPYQR